MKGTLLIAGGNIGATKQGKDAILGRFSELCGKETGTVLIVPCASGDPEDSAAYIGQELLNFGIGAVRILTLTENKALLQKGWKNLADESMLPQLEGITGVWFTGGDQLKTARLLLNQDGSDTIVLCKLKELLNSGITIGGTSAGAAIMSMTMIVRGDDAGVLLLPPCTDPNIYDDRNESPEQLLLSHGLGFLPCGIVDQHFNRRPRLQRLLKAMELSGESTGYGISEDTALEVSLSQNTVRVHGSAYVLKAQTTADGVLLSKLYPATEAVFQEK